MKYSSKNIPLQCYLKESTCYKSTTTMTIKGVLIHSTGANNPNLKRYVQPTKKNDNYSKILALLGKNTARNDWNHTYQEAGVNAWIGKLSDGTVAAVQTMPWNYRPWGCGAGRKGSCNNGWIQFEICEDGLTDANYFKKVYNEAVELTAYLCRRYGLNPNGTVTMNGVKIPVILCHADSYNLGFGTAHSDVMHWFKKHGKTMNQFRADVSKLLGGGKVSTSTSSTLKLGSSGSAVKTLQTNLNLLGYNCGSVDGSFGAKTETAVKKFQTDHGLSDTGNYASKTQAAMKSALAKCYKIEITASKLNVRSGAGTKYTIKKILTKGATKTIVGKGKDGTWGKLANSEGWISLKYTKKI